MAVLEARKLKKMDITGASDPYVKIKLFDNKVREGDEQQDISSPLFVLQSAGVSTCTNPLILSFPGQSRRRKVGRKEG